jgi:hypothetical protein
MTDAQIDGLVARLFHHSQDPRNTAFSRSTMRECIEVLAVINAASAQAPVAVPEGWKLVPVEPTKNMLAHMRLSLGYGNERHAYQSALNAAPPASTSDDAVSVAIYQEQDCAGHWIYIPRVRYNMIPNRLWKRIVYIAPPANTAPTPAAWLWNERPDEFNNYESRPRVTLWRPKNTEASSGMEPLYCSISSANTSVDAQATDYATLEEHEHTGGPIECKPGGCSDIGCEGGRYCFNADGSPKVGTVEGVFPRSSITGFRELTDERQQDILQAMEQHYGDTFRKLVDLAYAPKTEATPSYEKIDWNELSKRGLVRRINSEILHPLGLSVFYSPDTGVSAGAMISPDGKWEYPEDQIPKERT